MHVDAFTEMFRDAGSIPAASILRRSAEGRAMQNALRSFSEAGLFYLGPTTMKYVYLLESVSHPGKRYVGITEDLKKRTAEHNAGKSPHTSKYTPWQCVVAVLFFNHAKA